MPAKLIEAVSHFIEFPIRCAEKKLERLEPSLSWQGLGYTVIAALLIAVFGILFLIFEAWLGSRMQLPEWLAFFHHPIAPFAWLLLVPLVYALNLTIQYRRDRKAMCEELALLRTNTEALTTGLEALSVGTAEKAIQIFRLGMQACQNEAPLKRLLDGMEPDHGHIVKEIGELSKNTMERLKLLEKLTALPDAVRNSLSEFLNPDLLSKPWGPLYMTFAMKLQLDPWKQAQNAENYVFVRDLEEIACFYRDPADGQTIFELRLVLDLEEILQLVNGQLLSVMYRDLRAWDDDRYYKSNEQLLDRAARRGTELRRVFIYDQAWLDDPTRLGQLVKAALWHNETRYPSRFVCADGRTDLSALVDPAAEFMASCLINATKITMEQYLTNGSVSRYVYRCKTDTGLIERYRTAFDHVWNSDSQTPEGFLEIAKPKNEDVFNHCEAAHKTRNNRGAPSAVHGSKSGV